MILRYLFLINLICSGYCGYAQNDLKVFRMTSSFTSFPDTGRAAGHSGAYKVMAHILQNGNLPVKEVILFDALYGETNKYLNWIQSDPQNRLIDIYTNGGGTDGESREMVKKLIQLNIPVDTLEEINMTASLLQTQRIVFMHSLKKHNDVINHPDNFQLFLENSPFLKRIRK